MLEKMTVLCQLVEQLFFSQTREIPLSHKLKACEQYCATPNPTPTTYCKQLVGVTGE